LGCGLKLDKLRAYLLVTDGTEIEAAEVEYGGKDFASELETGRRERI
jgi:hypothetical protein